MKRLVPLATLIFVVGVFALFTVPQAQARDGDAQGCTNHSLRGAFVLTGNKNAIAHIGPVATLGFATADGKGNITATLTQSLNGLIIHERLTGTYSIAADCKGSLSAVSDPGARGVNVNFVVADEGKQIFNIETDPTAIVTFTETKIPDDVCRNARVKGTYGFETTGSIIGVGPVSSVGSITIDQDGNITGSRTISLNGAIAQESLGGTLAIGADCSGSASIVVNSSGATLHFDLVVSGNDGSEISALETDPHTVITMSAKRLSEE